MNDRAPRSPLSEFAKGKLIRDPIHGDLELTGTEVRIVDSDVFQRLRRIKQLSNTHLVFPGATHTRFEHSVGTMHVAGRMAHRLDGLKDDPKRVSQIRLTALLHDLGHGPFSHTSEVIMEELTGKEIGNVRIAGDAISLLDSLRNPLGGDYEAVADLLQKKTQNGTKVGVDYDILDGPIDGDKLDYLIRDSYYCGVPYGHPDILRILHSLRRIQPPAKEESYLGISPKGVEAVQNLQFARYQMHRIVYYHKTRRAADAMLVRAALIAITDEKTLDSNYYDYRPADRDFLNLYFELDDYSLARKITEGGRTAGALMRRVEKRDLFKMAVDVDPTRLGAMRYQQLQRTSRRELAEIEAEIASEVGAAPNDIIIDRANIDNPAFRGPSDALEEIKQVMVENEPLPKYLYEMPGVWTATERFVTHSIGVFCPEEFKEAVKDVAPRVIGTP